MVKTVKMKEDTERAAPQSTVASSAWMEENFDGQLAIDVYQTADAIVIKSPVAGVRPDDIDVSLTGDMVTIKGLRRPDEQVPDADYFYRECYWGGFSRSVILPVDVVADAIAATLKNGVLTVVLPKAKHPSSSIAVHEVNEA